MFAVQAARLARAAPRVARDFYLGDALYGIVAAERDVEEEVMGLAAAMAETAHFSRCTGQALNWENTHICVHGRQMQEAARLALPDFEAFAKATKSLS
eukprot:7891-Alexandrium_andersonii.AAC.1